MDLADLLGEHAARVAGRVVREESAKREHVVVYLSGAHAYGFPSPDSDLDLKAIHVARTSEIVGLRAPTLAFDRVGFEEGVEIDYTSNELGPVLASVLRGNGNYLERILGNTTLLESTLLAELRPLAERSLSRRVYTHYRGFSSGQLRELEKKPTAKRILYVLRTALTGLELLREGRLVADATRLFAPYGLDAAAELVERKRAGERTPLPPEVADAWRGRIQRLFQALDEARESSILPEEPVNASEVEEWLIETRRSRW